MISDAEAMTIVLKYLISNASNREFKSKLNSILAGIEGRKHIEERSHPRYKSILLFGHNIFPFSAEVYREMAIEIQGEHSKDEQ